MFDLSGILLFFAPLNYTKYLFCIIVSLPFGVAPAQIFLLSLDGSFALLYHISLKPSDTFLYQTVFNCYLLFITCIHEPVHFFRR